MITINNNYFKSKKNIETKRKLKQFSKKRKNNIMKNTKRKSYNIKKNIGKNIKKKSIKESANFTNKILKDLDVQIEIITKEIKRKYSNPKKKLLNVLFAKKNYKKLI